eukprot:4703632-Amphidinium_carterae.1
MQRTLRLHGILGVTPAKQDGSAADAGAAVSLCRQRQKVVLLLASGEARGSNEQAPKEQAPQASQEPQHVIPVPDDEEPPAE